MKNNKVVKYVTRTVCTNNEQRSGPLDEMEKINNATDNSFNMQFWVQLHNS